MKAERGSDISVCARKERLLGATTTGKAEVLLLRPSFPLLSDPFRFSATPKSPTRVACKGEGFNEPLLVISLQCWGVPEDHDLDGVYFPTTHEFDLWKRGYPHPNWQPERQISLFKFKIIALNVPLVNVKLLHAKCW